MGSQVESSGQGGGRGCCAGCGRAMGIFLILAALLGFVFSMGTLVSCDFLSIESPGNVGNLTIAGNRTSTRRAFEFGIQSEKSKELEEKLKEFNYVTVGMREWEPEDFGCRLYSGTSLSTALNTARIGALVGFLGGLIALISLFVEMVLIRFTCSRTITALSLLIAVLGQLLTFVAFAGDFCTSSPPGTNYEVNTCSMSKSAWWSIVAMVCYLVALILTCPTPKTKPFVRLMMERELNQQENDPCCYCFKKKEDVETAVVEEQESREEEIVKGEEQPTGSQADMHSAPSPPPKRSENYHASTTPVAPVSPSTIETYPTEVYAVHQPTKPQDDPYANACMTDGDLFFDAMTV